MHRGTAGANARLSASTDEDDAAYAPRDYFTGCGSVSQSEVGPYIAARSSSPCPTGADLG
ncbi:hypothetical protein MOX01_18320 [Microbacterium oxydans]|nr:hypothetical protein MOX01_18320 [Microbacterium oxydans]